MFSGGFDSTITAIHLAQVYDCIHLVTYKNHGLTGVWRSSIHATELAERHGKDRVIHFRDDIRPIHRRMLKGFFDDYWEYCKGAAPGIMCLSCKIAMHIRTIIYCLEHGITQSCDGAQRAQSSHPEMMVGVLNALRELYAHYGIRYFNPIYDFGFTDDKIKYLRERGYTIGMMVGQASKSVQPMCWVGPFSTVWHFSAPYQQEDMERYVRDKTPYAIALIDELLKEKGMVDRIPAQPRNIEPDDILEYKEIVPQSEINPRADHLISRAFTPLWLCFKFAFWLGSNIGYKDN